ncbi:RHS repeat-associated core domain-containing protein, partial [Pseudomonas viridiflava]
GELVRTLDKLRGEIKYEYEANGQLHSRDTGKLVDSEEFRYDAAANRLNFNTSRFDHVKDNRLKQWRDQEYSYDAWGNLIEKRSGLAKWQTFSYDCENRLVRSETMLNSQLHSTSTYQYDSLGRRVAKQSQVQGKTEHKRFLWQGLRMLREESPGQSSLYVYEPGSYAPLSRVDQKEGEAENKVYYFHTDQIGTPLEMTDIDGQIVWQATYKAWGSLEALTVNEVEQNLRFQGQYFDEETGLHYNTFRYYDPEVGRFITQDPIGLEGGFNLYQYAPSAIGWIDPFGLTGFFTSSTFVAPSGSTHKVYQQVIDWDLPVNTRDGIRTKLELATEGRTPFVVKNGSYSQLNLYHSKQDRLGALFELSADTHQKFGSSNALHPHLPNQHSINPVDRDLFNGGRDAYWKGRAQSEIKSRNSGGTKISGGCG